MAIAEPSTGDAPEIEDGLYEVTCTGVSDPFEEMDFNGKKKIKKVRIFLQVHGTDDGEGNEEMLDPKVNLKWSPGGNYPPSTLYVFATAFCGPQDGDVAFDTDNLINKRARATIKTEPGKWPKVTDMMALKKNGQSAPTAAQEARQPTNVDDVPFDTGEPSTGASTINAWLDSMKAVGFNTKEIIDLCKSRFEKLPRDLSDLERDLLQKEYAT
jgi:hypothetical protein